METIASLAEMSDTLDTMSKWARIMQKAGANFRNLIQLPITDKQARANLVAYVNAGCPEFPVTTQEDSADLAAYKFARKILGSKFISPREVEENVSGVFYSEAQQQHLRTCVPIWDEFQDLERRGSVLLPSDPRLPSTVHWLTSTLSTDGWGAFVYKFVRRK